MIKNLLYKTCPTCKGKGYQGVSPASIEDASTVETNSSVSARTEGAITLCVTCLGTGAIKINKEKE